MIRPRVSRFPARKQALAAVAVLGAVGVAATACASGSSGTRSASASATTSGTRPSPPRTSTGPDSPSSPNGQNGQGSPNGSAGSTGSSGNTGTGTTPPNSSNGSPDSPGSPNSPTTPGAPPSNVTTPTAPGYQPPAVPRTNSDVDCSVAKCIALTFDDGPGPDTGRLLDLLKAQNAPATFFVLGNQAVKYPDLVHREYAEGNEVGNHTWDHKDLSKLSAAAVQDEINRAADAIAEAGIPRPTLVRPPYGAVNDTVRAVAGFPFIMWRVDPEDWKYPDPARVADQIVSHAKPGRIVISHDIHKTTVDAVPAVIQRLKQQGYTFVTVSTLMKGVELRNGQSYFNRPPAATTGNGQGQGQGQGGH
ncbi:polysaccharide deacetylase family protein [Catenulispora pinisilvae]|uniref:polysaccharide deacetylase family protein n=1 Tax=Catenulispora pinisilvae TaxID=2705253 RepID=UPI001891AF53|nr:polysaccharide deacetylase family protein [Catenulispora pinisilvae]